jgi:hypothetical protein
MYEIDWSRLDVVMEAEYVWFSNHKTYE